jgi:hypothetical protein
MTWRSVNAKNLRAAALVERQVDVDSKRIVWPVLSSLDCQEPWRVSRDYVSSRESLQGSNGGRR